MFCILKGVPSGYTLDKCMVCMLKGVPSGYTLDKCIGCMFKGVRVDTHLINVCSVCLKGFEWIHT